MMRMRSADEFKGFVTRVDDRYTEKNSNLSTSHPRRAVLWGTSNDSEILNDHTGNRRVWIIRTGARRLDPNWIEENRDSIWATVLTWMDWGLSNYLPDDSLSAGLAAQRAQAATLSDPWADDIRNALERADIDPQVGVGQDVLLRRYLGKDPSAKDAKKEAVRLKDIITGVGFRTHDGQYRWEKEKYRYPTVNDTGGLGGTHRDGATAPFRVPVLFHA
jgi:predicted P-loop ATPase